MKRQIILIRTKFLKESMKKSSSALEYQRYLVLCWQQMKQSFRKTNSVWIKWSTRLNAQWIWVFHWHLGGQLLSLSTWKVKKSPSELFAHANAEDGSPKARQSFSWHLQTDGKKEKVATIYLVLLVATHPCCPHVSSWNISPGHQPLPLYTLFSYVQVILQHLLGHRHGGSMAVVIVYQFRRVVCIFP